MCEYYKLCLLLFLEIFGGGGRKLKMGGSQCPPSPPLCATLIYTTQMLNYDIAMLQQRFNPCQAISKCWCSRNHQHLIDGHHPVVDDNDGREQPWGEEKAPPCRPRPRLWAQQWCQCQEEQYWTAHVSEMCMKSSNVLEKPWIFTWCSL